jgi:hypothetical protein
VNHVPALHPITSNEASRFIDAYAADDAATARRIALRNPIVLDQAISAIPAREAAFRAALIAWWRSNRRP